MWHTETSTCIVSQSVVTAGIASEGVEALRCGRRFVGVELKPSYFATAVKNLREAAARAGQPNLFSLVEEGDDAAGSEDTDDA